MFSSSQHPSLWHYILFCLCLSPMLWAAELPPMPAEYPTSSPSNPYTETPFAKSYAKRHAAFIKHELNSPGGGVFGQLLRLEYNKAPHEAEIQRTLDKMNDRRDCADFGLQGVLRLAYHHKDNPLLSDEMKKRIHASILNFKYWPDEPGIDSICSWSENHFILFATGGYLSGQLYPDTVFTNSGRTGREQMERFRPRILRWLELRYKTGFSEWLSNVYYEEDLAALFNLADLCEDKEIAQRAAMVIDLILADIALNSFNGIFGSTHGRSYEGNKTRPHGDNTHGVTKLAFGMHRFKGGLGSIPLAINRKYQIPRVLYEIAADQKRPQLINKQRMGIKLEDAPEYGLDFNRLEDGMTFLTMEAYCHPRVINLFARMLDEYNWWENEFFESFKANRTMVDTLRDKGMLAPAMWFYEKDVTRNLRTEANIYTYRTPDYMLSTAQDHRPGYGGDQQSIWQATLGPGAVCFTTHPEKEEQKSPSYWTGSGTLPRVAQHENVVIALYKIDMSEGLYLTHTHAFTHAWLDQDYFDEVQQHDHWTFAKKDNAYLALWSKKPVHWQEQGKYKDKELIAPGKRNIWICEMGNKKEHRSFRRFIQKILDAPLEAEKLTVLYTSPTQGELTFGWDEKLRKDGTYIKLDDYPRYENPYGFADFPAGSIRFEHNGEFLELDWENGTRNASTMLTRD